eukprot:5613635-Prymnesium_polylepis.1
MSDWTAAELSARGPNAQPCTSPYCVKIRARGYLTYGRYEDTREPTRANGRTHPANGLNPPPRARGQLTYGRYVVYT